MKKHFIFLIAIMGFFASCDDKSSEVIEEQELLGELKADFNARSFDGVEKQVFGIGERVTFFDISSGNPDARVWELEGALEQQASEQIITAYYDKVGTYPVKLSISRLADNGIADIEKVDYITIEHVEVTAQLRADLSEENGILEVIVGNIVKFEDVSSGLPDEENRVWEFEGGTVIEDNGRVQVVQYLQGGEFNVKLSVGRTTDLNSDNSFSEIVKESYVHVIAPDPYFVVGQGEMVGLDQLRLPMEREALAFNSDEVKNAFTVTVTNGTFTKEIAVNSIEQVAATKNSDAYLMLKLDEMTYNSDLLSITYNSEAGQIYAHDGGKYGGNLESFTNHEVVPFIDESKCEVLKNDADWAGFEKAGGVNAGGATGFWVGNGNTQWLRATNNVYQGVGSMHYTGPKTSKNLYGMNITNKGDIKAGDYLIAIRMFIPEGNNLDGVLYSAQNKVGGKWLAWITSGVIKTSSVAHGRWETVYHHMTLKEDLLQKDDARLTWKVRSSDNPNATGNLEFYMDELRIIPLQSR